MKNPKVKLVPHKEVKEVFIPDFVDFDGQTLKLSFEMDNFQPGETFDAILEEDNRLKFLKAVIQQKKENEAIFGVFSSRDLIKREYERISVLLDVVSSDFYAKTLNISAGGMQIRTEQELEVGKIYEAKIKFDSKDISVQYEVLRSKNDKNSYLVSGRFVDIDKDSKAYIMQQNLKNKIFSLKTLPIREESGGING